METDAPRILIVDNDEAVAEAIAVRLRNAGYACVTAYNGGDAEALFQDDPFDLIISDLIMPESNGIDLAESVRRISEAPIIFLTGFSGEHEDRLHSLPNVSVLCKPFDESTLIDLVETELALSRS